VIDYSDIYYWGSSNVAVLKDSPIQSLADLKGKSILIVKGGNQIKWLRDHIPDVQFVQLNSASDSLQAPSCKVGPKVTFPTAPRWRC
jgi:polar amino acid transport system substrate-binding protein